MLEQVREIVQPVYMVGGSVRDIYLNRIPGDFDFTTPLKPDEIEQAIRNAGRKPYLVGKRFGTIGVKIDGQMIEITTFRAEKYEMGSRKPHVEFVKNLTSDLSRRDFTINAMAIRDKGNLIDPFGGLKDIQNRTIRAVGSARTRFKEDPLRMLRASRFASQLGFGIEETTLKRMTDMSHKILEVSKERWMIELDKLLLGDYTFTGCHYLMESRLLNFMIPELALQKNYDQNSRYHDLSLWEHTMGVVKVVPKDINMRWAALLHDIAKPFVRVDKVGRSVYAKHDILGEEIVERLARHLKWSNERRNAVKELVRNHLEDDSPLRGYDNMYKNKEI